MTPFERRAQAERARVDPELDEPTIMALRAGRGWPGTSALSNALTEPEMVSAPAAPVPVPGIDRKAKAIAGLIAIIFLTFIACGLLTWFLWTYQPVSWGG